jgi:hypothetical protein
MWSPQLKETALQIAINRGSKEKLSAILTEATISKEQKTALKLSFATPASASENSSAGYWA